MLKDELEAVLPRLQALFKGMEKLQGAAYVTSGQGKDKLPTYSVYVPNALIRRVKNTIDDIIEKELLKPDPDLALPSWSRPRYHDKEHDKWTFPVVVEKWIPEEERGWSLVGMNALMFKRYLFCMFTPEQVIVCLEKHKDEIKEALKFDLDRQIEQDETLRNWRIHGISGKDEHARRQRRGQDDIER